MKGNYDQFSGLSKDELVQLCAELQDKVTKTISLKQELIGIKNDLDQELNRFRMIEEFGREGIFQDSIESFGVLAVESFVQVFEQPHCLIAEYSKEQKRLQILYTFGFNNISIPKYVDFDAQYLSKKEGFFLQQEAYLNDKIKFLQLQDALIGPFFDSQGGFSGLIICGQMSRDKLFYSPIKPNDRHAFTVMSRKAGYLLQNFRYNQKLKLEIEIRTAIEKELEAKANDLMRSNKDLEQFAYIVSHDLKAPLLNIAGFAQLLESKYKNNLDENGREYLNFILEGVRRFKGVIEALLQFSRNVRAAELKETVPLNQIFENIQRSFAFTIHNRNAIIEISELPKVQANKDLLQQLFQNIISNALKFIPKETTPLIQINGKERVDDFLISVTDNGIGIEPKFLKDIFIPFRRLNHVEDFEGNGIGLSICKKIIEQHNGRIWADSEGKGQGTIFYVSLPK